ncbi:MAG: PEP-utilizing enzyme [Patescibacteria group bacterium]
MKKIPVYEKLFARDFCLASVEAWVRGESTNPKGWTDLKQPFLPYIITERFDNTIRFNYDLQGVDWICDLLAKLAQQDKSFLKKIEKTVLEKLKYIRPIYEKEKIISLPELKRFLKELGEGYPWFEAMWWFFQMDESKVEDLDLKNLEKVRMLTDTLCNGSDTVIRKSLIEIYPDLGELSSVLSTREILSGNLPRKEELIKRDHGYFFGNNKLLVGKNRTDIEKIFKIKFKVKKFDSAVLQGRVAQIGIARGFVRRVMGHKQIGKFKNGEILVSSMTIPDFLPAMKKAAAIITDEGGILCHAAILARELNVPCITGTQFATHILRDGDYVEVDANNGIVKFIKSP